MNKIACLILMLTSSLYAQSKVGSSAAAFLGSGVGSRAIGMGGAFSAVGEMPLYSTGILARWLI